VLSYSWSAPAGTINGLSIDIDFGNNFSTGAKSIVIGGGFDCRATPGVSTGTVSNPPVPEIRTATDDIAWNQRFFEASYTNGVTPGSATQTDMVYIGQNDATTGGNQMVVKFQTAKRALPTMAIYDGAGTLNKDSYGAANTSTLTNADSGLNPSAPFLIGTKGFMLCGTNAQAHASTFVHYTADASLTGA